MTAKLDRLTQRMAERAVERKGPWRQLPLSFEERRVLNEQRTKSANERAILRERNRRAKVAKLVDAALERIAASNRVGADDWALTHEELALFSRPMTWPEIKAALQPRRLQWKLVDAVIAVDCDGPHGFIDWDRRTKTWRLTDKGRAYLKGKVAA